ncbi:family transcriptional regulator [Lasius niger]|uniref:Family transcriptional regulator n=1 Tax=Lasius niger TaxID=67767 RepID=A0A0J7K1V4_LASNI|nr:family transcriptional regulator [Lasius niger]
MRRRAGNRFRHYHAIDDESIFRHLEVNILPAFGLARLRRWGRAADDCRHILNGFKQRIHALPGRFKPGCYMLENPVIRCACAMSKDRNRPTFLPYDLHLLIHKLEEYLIQAGKPHLQGWQLSKQQFRILRYLYEQGPLEPRQIVAICRIPSPSLTGILVRMEKLDLVQRQRLAQDQRRLLITLTDKSRMILYKIIPEFNAHFHAFESKLPPGFLQQFIDQTYKMISALKVDFEEKADLKESAG